MEPLFRKHFWVFTAAFVGLVALIAAWTASDWAGGKLRGPRAFASGGAARPPAQPAAVPSFDALARLTGLPPPAQADEAPGAEEPGAGLAKTTLPVKLLGTLVATDPRWSIATVQDLATQKSASYLVGEDIQGAEVLAISRGEVLVRNAGRRELITPQPGEGPTPAPAASPTPVAAVGPRVEPGGGAPKKGPQLNVRPTGENQYELPRQELTRTLANLNDVALQARIVPAFKDGVAQGFKLFSIRPDSIYAKIGVQNGDVIRRINGFDLNSPEKALEVYSKLKESSRIDIEIERNGSVIRNTYNIR